MTQFVWPNGTLTEPTCTDVYGPRAWAAPGVRAFHTGDDAVGFSKVRSIGSGTVIESSYIDWAGWQVLIYLGELYGVRTWVRVCHLAEKSSLKRGDAVAPGTLIGVMGMTGVAFGVHLHWELYRGSVDRGGGTGSRDVGSTVDPRAFVRALIKGSTKGTKVIPTRVADHTARNGGRVVSRGGRFFLNSAPKAKPSSATNLVDKPGEYGISLSIYAEGEPGDIIEVVLQFQTAGKVSYHYRRQMEIGPDGLLRAGQDFRPRVGKGSKVYGELNALRGNKSAVKVTLFDSTAHQYV